MRIRYFAGAADAAGREESALSGPLGAAQLREALASAHGPEFARVLGRCSLLVDGVRLGSEDAQVPDAATVDVLPPFAGG
jgi:molybdopterin synthase sulfur carrier subunit